ncbi:hypothetical protein CTA1_5905 [Colletotrichum tanaceti]|uniref:Extracellular membrane protein CFEM domain-containing protein n=1 Tax=Colletotrichum tanaceti TaxID=1306861 RepID=A0A4U6WZJ1_9PEZI|nr:hypothetical protein CTA1_5905 [Colletotrichum tanaceti]
MRFSIALTIFAAGLVVAAPTPAPAPGLFSLGDKGDNDGKGDKDDKKKDGGAIAVCETATAAEHVSCIEACKKDAACIVLCTSKAVGGYTGCAGVGSAPKPAPKATPKA